MDGHPQDGGHREEDDGDYDDHGAATNERSVLRTRTNQRPVFSIHLSRRRLCLNLLWAASCSSDPPRKAHVKKHSLAAHTHDCRRENKLGTAKIFIHPKNIYSTLAL